MVRRGRWSGRERQKRALRFILPRANVIKPPRAHELLRLEIGLWLEQCVSRLSVCYMNQANLQPVRDIDELADVGCTNTVVREKASASRVTDRGRMIGCDDSTALGETDLE
jgi:hypothetical protein